MSDLSVSLEEMRGAAKGWDSAGASLSSAGRAAAALKQSRIEAGIFQLSYASYMSAVEYISTILAAGATESEKVAPTLRSAADVYEYEDRQGAHAIKNAGG